MDPSIGNYIKVVVVKIILVEEIDAAKELQVSTNADSTLASFCRWQQGLNPGDDENPHHHDVAILVTRKDICSQHNSPCRYGLYNSFLPLMVDRYFATDTKLLNRCFDTILTAIYLFIYVYILTTH